MLLQPCILDLLLGVLNQPKLLLFLNHYICSSPVSQILHTDRHRESADDQVRVASTRTSVSVGDSDSVPQQGQLPAVDARNALPWRDGRARLRSTVGVPCFVGWVSLGTSFILPHVQGGGLCVPSKSSTISSVLQSVSSILSELRTCSQCCREWFERPFWPWQCSEMGATSSSC